MNPDFGPPNFAFKYLFCEIHQYFHLNLFLEEKKKSKISSNDHKIENEKTYDTNVKKKRPAATWHQKKFNFISQHSNANF